MTTRVGAREDGPGSDLMTLPFKALFDGLGEDVESP